MKINSNIEININKWREFLEVFFKENEDTVEILVKEYENIVEVKSSNLNKEIVFTLEKLVENQVDLMMKASLIKLYNINNSWGSLVGVRPTKLVRKLKENYDNSSCKEILEKLYLLSKDKIDLLINIHENSKDFLDFDTTSLYIGHSFCPTKCTYCSFPAYLKQGKYLQKYEEYFSCLIREIKETLKACNEAKLNITTLYIGGGTPSYLDYEELEIFLNTIRENLKMEKLLEFTFEAGRIDTLDEEKLLILKKYGVTRISINPQSFKKETLKLVNRYHDIDQLNLVYSLSKKIGFDINMDLIMGLPKENTQDMLNTLDEISKYDAQNITIHYLAMKKASYLNKKGYIFEEEIDYKLIEEKTEEIMRKNGYIPYYIYRQKNSAYNGANIGYCKKGKQLIYNIEMIEENKNVIAIGAGAISKIIKKDNIVRLVNPKDPLMWVNEFENRLEEKIKIIKGLR